jgi:uncharacterized protein (DUF488 family)
MANAFFTIGHSTRTITKFVALLSLAGVKLVADVRTVPRSRSNPQYNRDALPASLAPFNLAYEHIAALGGLRGRSPSVAEDVNGFWQNQSFHNYADYALTEPFRAGLARLIELGKGQPCAIMCSEAVWWRCHRRLVADYLMHGGNQVYHLMGSDRIQAATPTPAATAVTEGRLVYPAEYVLKR